MRKAKDGPDTRRSFRPSRPMFWRIACFVPVLAFLFASSPRFQLSRLTSHFQSRINTNYGYFTTFTTPTPPFFSTRTSASTVSTNMSYSQELLVASLAVQRASLLTKKVFHEKAKGTLSKTDKSPVTKGDFGAQALIIKALKTNFPEDEIVAEEEAAELRADKSLSDEIWELVQDIKLDDEGSDKLLGGPVKDQEEMLQVIDSGKSKGGRQGRVWALDPIDGTKGFLRGGQYAVCLALIVDGDVKVGAIGTPNLPHEDNAPIPVDLESMSDDASKYGVLFSAVKGEGAYNAPLTSGALAEKKKITMRPVPSISHAIFCEGVEASHSNHNDNQAVADKLGIANAPVRLDSQAKYCSIARGAGDIYLRLPLKWEYQEKIWDHAAGEILVKEAGGVVSDIYGKPLDFGVGRTLSENKGVIAAPKQVHADIVKATKEVLKVE